MDKKKVKKNKVNQKSNENKNLNEILKNLCKKEEEEEDTSSSSTDTDIEDLKEIVSELAERVDDIQDIIYSWNK